MDAASKKSMIEKLESYGLKCKALPLTNRDIIIHETNGHSIVKLNELFARYLSDETLSDVRKNGLLTVYAPLAACSAGDVPDEDEFHWMKNDDVETWVREARAMNPSIFARLDEQEKLLSELTDDEKAKKKPRRRKSS